MWLWWRNSEWSNEIEKWSKTAHDDPSKVQHWAWTTPVYCPFLKLDWANEHLLLNSRRHETETYCEAGGLLEWGKSGPGVTRQEWTGLTCSRWIIISTWMFVYKLFSSVFENHWRLLQHARLFGQSLLQFGCIVISDQREDHGPGAAEIFHRAIPWETQSIHDSTGFSIV